MNKINILFELGVEEIPSGYIKPAIEALNKALITLLEQSNLSYSNLQMFSTPRRFAFIINELDEKQEDKIIEKVGPSINIAYDDNGNLSKAAMGFLRSANSAKDDIFIKKTNKGDKIAIKKKIKGKLSKQILKEKLPEIIFKLNFPKSMRWGNYKKSFARPIRWILALLNDEVWDFSLDNIEVSNFTYGNRFLGLENKVMVDKISEYEEILLKHFVVADSEKRKKLIIENLNKIETKIGQKVVKNDALIEEVNNLIEFPTAVLAEFDKKYLKLPEKIIISTLSKNQKYFALTDEKNNLTGNFIFISNGNPNYNEIIKIGNQKVVKARLEDAEFYFQEDIKHPLDYFVPKLKEVLFHKEIGNLYDKTLRVKELSDYIANKLLFSDEQRKIVNRAAYLCKSDLVTLMLGEKEFTKLQGYIGSKYALIAGEKEEVAQAIYEHYLPKGKNDDLPKTIYGAILAIADKMDTVCSIFSVNQIPTGSNDPFALRRAAIGIVKIIDKYSFEFNLFDLIDKAFSLLKKNKNKNKVYDFFKARINWFLGEIGIDYDVINSVTHIDYSNISNLKKRAVALQNYKMNEDFKKLVMTFKRVSNIIMDFKPDNEIDKNLFEKKEENELYEGILQLENRIQPLLENKDYIKIMETLVDFSPLINRFFDNVLVNVENEKIKNNRYALLYKIRKIFLTFADLNKLD